MNFDGAQRREPRWINARAIYWVFYEAKDVPASCVATLSGLASHANGDGTPERPMVNGWNAHPTIKALAAIARKSDRQVARDIEELLKRGHVRIPRDQSATAYLPADKRPTAFDLGYSELRPFIDPSELDTNTKGRRRRPSAKQSSDLSSTSGREADSDDDLSSTSGGDLSSMTERPDVHDQTDLSSTSGKEVVEEVGKKNTSAGKPARARKPATAKSTEHQVADDLTAAFWKLHGKGRTQPYVAVLKIVRSAIRSGVERDDLAWALDQVAAEGSIASWKLDNALIARQRSKGQPRGGARSDTSTTNKELNL